MHKYLGLARGFIFFLFLNPPLTKPPLDNQGSVTEGVQLICRTNNQRLAAQLTVAQLVYHGREVRRLG